MLRGTRLGEQRDRRIEKSETSVIERRDARAVMIESKTKKA